MGFVFDKIETIVMPMARHQPNTIAGDTVESNPDTRYGLYCSLGDLMRPNSDMGHI